MDVNIAKAPVQFMKFFLHDLKVQWMSESQRAHVFWRNKFWSLH